MAGKGGQCVRFQPREGRRRKPKVDKVSLDQGPTNHASLARLKKANFSYQNIERQGSSQTLFSGVYVTWVLLADQFSNARQASFSWVNPAESLIK